SIGANETDMLITLSDGQVVTITNWYSSYTSRIEQFEFADGTTWQAADVLANMVIAGTDGDDTISNKYLLHSTNYDMGGGNDSVYGGKGDDTYLYNLGDGNDTINDYSGTDTLRFGAGITADNISIGANETDMLITLSDGQVVTITNWYSSYTSRIEQFEFADGTTWQAEDIINKASLFADVTPVSNASSIDSNLNLLIQSYSGFDDVSDESGWELSKGGNSIVLPVLESSI
ncbi:MAG: hypothetical protein GY928_05055, partial [Colwellia sp.]|nr:hypothetical protein [Colwellia sp.]